MFCGSCQRILPSDFQTDWLGQSGGQKMVAGFPRRRLMDDQALDGAMAWLVSDAARFTSGAVVQIDDGQAI